MTISQVHPYPKAAALAVVASTAGEVLMHIPEGRVVNQTPGRAVLALPHTPAVVHALESLGAKDVPTPMTTLYDWPGRFAPFDAQRQTADFATMNERCFILNSMGLGKTMTSLWAFDFLKKRGWVNKALVVCPLSTMERTWADEVFKSFPDLKANVVYGSADKRRRVLADTSADLYIINTDGVQVIKDELAQRPDIDLIIIDEVALFRNKGTARWKIMNEVCNKQVKRKVWGMTGSPTPNSPTDAWAQVKLVNPELEGLPRYFGRFRDQVMFRYGPFEWRPKPDAVQTVQKIMQPSIRFSLDDCLDLPPQTIVQREVAMTSEQTKAYKDMLNRLVFEYQAQEVTATNEAVKAFKLLQVCCGVAYDNEGQNVVLPITNRIDVLEEVINESEGKVIVFIPFTAALQNVVDTLRARGFTAEVIDGSVSKNERDRIFGDFQNAEHPRVLVANPVAMSHGLTLTAATTIVWFGPTYNNEVYQQACARVRRPGQKRTTVIVQFVSSSLERKIYKRLNEKQSLQGALLDLIAESV